MAARWIYGVDATGIRVTPDFMERLRAGDAAALRSLNKQKLTLLYRRNFNRASRRPDAEGLFWSSTPHLHVIPLVRGSRHSPPAWLKADILAETLKEKKNTYYPPKVRERAQRQVESYANFVRKRMKAGEETVFMKGDGNSVTAWNMKPNPKFELVVINRHDRAALLKLLGELDAAANVESWLADRTRRAGATAPSILHADYAAWCAKRGEPPAGLKNFAQALVAAGVAKLTRKAGGVRYELELR